MVFPNDVALDPRGNVYATDTVEGAVWRIPTAGAAEPWAQHPLLEGTGALGFPLPIGANGIAFRDNRIIVANTELGLLVEIAVQPDGSAGEPAVIAESDALFGTDGIALDVHGDFYVVSAVHNTVTRVRHDGAIDTLATAGDGSTSPAHWPSGPAGATNQTLFVANFSLFAPAPTPAVLTLPVGEPGQPVP